MVLNKKILMQKETFRRYKISNYIAEIYQNEDYDKIITDDFLYYQTNADFCEMQNISLNEEIDFAKSVQQIFRNQGWQAEIIAEFEELL